TRLHDHFDVALAVEPARIADIGVVEDDVQDVRRLGPAGALEVNAELGAHRSASDIERQRGRLDPECSGLLALVADVDKEAMGAAEIIRHIELELGTTDGVRARLRHHLRALLPAAGADAVAGDPRPVQLISLAGLESL